MGKSLPSCSEGNDLLKGKNDTWGNQIRYETDGSTYTLISAGRDGVIDTSDDIPFGPFSEMIPYDMNQLPDDVQKRLEEIEKKHKEQMEKMGPLGDEDDESKAVGEDAEAKSSSSGGKGEESADPKKSKKAGEGG